MMSQGYVSVFLAISIRMYRYVCNYFCTLLSGSYALMKNAGSGHFYSHLAM